MDLLAAAGDDEVQVAAAANMSLEKKEILLKLLDIRLCFLGGTYGQKSWTIICIFLIWQLHPTIVNCQKLVITY
jgi:hypothetical protein